MKILLTSQKGTLVALLATILLALTLHGVSHAQTYSHIHVDAVNGINALTGRGSAANPYKSITYALLISTRNNLPDPWHVHISPGTYDADPAKPVTAREIFPLRLRSEMIFEGTTTAEECIIDGQYTGETTVPLLHGEGPVTIRNLTVQNSLRIQGRSIMNAGGIVLRDPTGDQATPSTLEACIIHNNKGGGVWSNMPLILTGNTFSNNINNFYDGVWYLGGAVVVSGNTTARGSGRTDVTDNVFSHNDNHGLVINGNFVGNVSGNIFQDMGHTDQSSAGSALRVNGTLNGDVTHNTFTRNGKTAFGIFGAALVASNLIGNITDNTFEKNMAGAIVIFHRPGVGGTVTGDIARNTFTDNTNPRTGGNRSYLAWEAGGFVVGTLTGNVTHNTFTRNIRNDIGSSPAAGGFVVLETLTGNVTHNTFTGNNLPFPARGSTGGGRGGGSGGFRVKTLIGNVTDNNFTNNSAISWGRIQASKGGGFQIDTLSGNISRNIFDTNSTSSDGGGFWVDTLTGNISHNKFAKNLAPTPADRIITQKLNADLDVCGGGGFWVGTLSGDISYNIFDSNFGSNAGGFWVQKSPNVVKVFNNIFINNSTDPDNSWVPTKHATHFMNNLFISDVSEHEASAFAVEISSPDSRVHNNIFSGVKTAIYITDAFDLPITHNLFHNVKINFVNQAGNELGNDLEFWELFAVNATNNLEGDPRFVDLTTQGFHLQAASPAINAGTNEFAPADDFDGVVRPVGATVDIGPYEFGGPSVTPTDTTDEPVQEYPAWDVNADGKTDITDLVLVATALGTDAPDNPRLDVNGDGTVNVQDLILVATHLGESTVPATPDSVVLLARFTPETLQQVAGLLRTQSDGSLAFQRAIANVEQLLAVLTPKETRLLANYPNPFNPETWIPYQLAKPAAVTVSIYATDGKLVRTLALGHLPAGIYQSKSRAAYWDGTNEQGESVASGVYFYTLKAGDFSATKKMWIRK